MHTGGVRASLDQSNVHIFRNAIDSESIVWKSVPVFTAPRSTKIHKEGKPENGGNPTEETSS